MTQPKLAPDTTQPAPQPSHRKVLIATSLTTNEINIHFRRVLERYTRTDNLREAEFVIFDLNNPPKKWRKYIEDRDDPDECLHIPSNAHVPCLIRFDGSPKNENQELIKEIKQHIEETFSIDLRFSPDSKQLLEDLMWLECMFPYQKSLPAATLKASTNQAIAIQRQELS
jgi:hypothetical protein